MAIKREVYEELKKMSGRESSWALYPDFDKDAFGMDIFNQPEIWNLLNDKYVILALNPGKDVQTKPWINFHSDVGKGARRLRDVTKNSVLEGSYITDVYKNVFEKNSGKLKSFDSDEQRVQASLPILRNELELLHHPLIITLGSGVKSFVKKHLPDYESINTWHYSYIGRKSFPVSDVKYYEHWWQTLSEYGISTPQKGYQEK